MTAENVLLDPDLVVDLLAERRAGGEGIKEVVDGILRGGGRLWLVAATLPLLLERLEAALSEKGGRGAAQEGAPERKAPPSSTARERLLAFLERADVLSSYAFQARSALQSEAPLKALLLSAAERLSGAWILSCDPAFAAAHEKVLTPEAFAQRQPPERAEPGPLPFVDLARQQQRILPEIEKGISAVLRHGRYIMGPEIERLEQELAAFAKVEHAVCCASGTDALLLALLAYDVGPGDALFTTPFTFIASSETIALLGATPIFVDIDPRTFNLDPDALLRAIQACRVGDPEIHPLPALAAGKGTLPRPRGILAVDLFGLPADYDRINAVAAANGLFVIEDAAQSFGAAYHGRPAGSLAEIGCTSFFPAKPLGCYGDGGAVFTRNGALAEKVRSLRVHGMGANKYDNDRIGLNARMDTLQAAVLLAKLPIFPHEISARDRVALRYTEALADCDAVQTPWVPEGLSSAWAQYSILTDRREALRSALQARGIPTAVYYPKPLHLQKAFAGLGYREGSFPVAESVSRRILSLPMHPYLTESQISRIAGEIGALSKG